MRRTALATLCLVGLPLAACSSASNAGFFPNPDGGGSSGSSGGSSGSSGSSGGSSGSSGGPTLNGDGGSSGSSGSSGTTTTTIYANTDDSLYSMDPQTKSVTLIGKFAGLSGATGDSTITDVAVNGNGDVYVNSESVIYKAALPASPGTVQLTKIANIALKSSQRFYALAFAPAGVLGSGEALVGGDGAGELWSIDATSGATKDLGSFGPDPRKSTNVLSLSGDVVFYVDANGKPTGLATIRSCPKTGSCSSSSDFLAGIDMTALAGAFTSGNAAATLLAGIYGGSGGTNLGSGTGFGDLFGLGAWQGDVFGFQRASASPDGKTPELVQIDTTSGKGTALTSVSFSFTNGWSGAGVTTKVSVDVPPPPPK